MNAPDALMVSLIEVIELALRLYMWVIIIGAVMSWLLAFGVVNRSNRFVVTVMDFCRRMTDPFLAPIRRKLKPFNGIDLSPLLLILIIYFLQIFLWRLAI